MRIVFVGATQFSREKLQHLLAMGVTICGVVTRPDPGPHSDFSALDDLCTPQGIPLHKTRDSNNTATLDFVRHCQADYIFCFGWSQLLNASWLSATLGGVIGYHPALLPQNRGRHPIIWALALGLKRTGSTFFIVDEGTDSGDIVSQQEVVIESDDDAGTLYAKLLKVALQQLDDLVPRLANRSFSRLVQDAGRANYWRKRSTADGEIDWRMGMAQINNLIRALARPYPGARAKYQDAEITVWRSKSAAESVAVNLEPGRVLSRKDNSILVKCGDGAVWLEACDPVPSVKVDAYLR